MFYGTNNSNQFTTKMFPVTSKSGFFLETTRKIHFQRKFKPTEASVAVHQPKNLVQKGQLEQVFLGLFLKFTNGCI